MSEIRRVNTGDAPRNVYHAGDAPRTVNTGRTVKTGSALNQDEYEAARRRAQQLAANNTRRTRSFNRVQQTDIDRYRAAQQKEQGASTYDRDAFEDLTFLDEMDGGAPRDHSF